MNTKARFVLILTLALLAEAALLVMSRARHSLHEQNIGCGGGSPRSMIRIRRPDPYRKLSAALLQWMG
jgi:hypothetical protein